MPERQNPSYHAFQVKHTVLASVTMDLGPNMPFRHRPFAPGERYFLSNGTLQTMLYSRSQTPHLGLGGIYSHGCHFSSPPLQGGFYGSRKLVPPRCDYILNIFFLGLLSYIIPGGGWQIGARALPISGQKFHIGINPHMRTGAGPRR